MIKKKKRKATEDNDLPTAPSMPEQSMESAIFCFFGVPGIGKTFLVNAMAPGKTYFLSFDKGTRYLNTMRKEIVDYAGIDDILTKLEKKQRKTGSLPYEIVCIDHIDAFALCCETKTIEDYNDNKKDNQPIATRLNEVHGGWGAGQDIYEKLMRRLQARLSQLDALIVFIAHEDDKPVKIDGKEFERTQPRMDKRTWKVFTPLMHIIGRMSWKRVKVKGRAVKVRILQTIQTTDDLVTKDQTNRIKPDIDEPHELIDTTKHVEKFLKSFRERESNGDKDNKEEEKINKKRRKKGRKKR